MNSFLVQGLILGFAVTAPVGPIGALCIRRTLEQDWSTGFATGIGAAVADATYGSIAALGLTAVSRFLIDQHSWLSLVGGVFLCGFGVRTMLRRPPAVTATDRGSGLPSRLPRRFS